MTEPTHRETMARLRALNPRNRKPMTKKERQANGFNATPITRKRKKPVLICTMEECKKPAAGRGLCGTHYQRFYRHGTPDPQKEIDAAKAEG